MRCPQSAFYMPNNDGYFAFIFHTNSKAKREREREQNKRFLNWLFNFYNMGWFFYYLFYRSIFFLLFLNSPQTIWRLLLNFDFGFSFSWMEPWRQADIEDVHETKCKKEFETQAAWQSFEICCPSKEIHCKSLF